MKSMTSPNLPKTASSGRRAPTCASTRTNPVDWYPWGDEAFEQARREDKPVFLSIGYSSCHWCHVMERESFDDEEVARLLNETFVCVKVDREERPDLDQYYMTVGQMLTGAGGWPLTIVMTPDKKPFFAGTYFPKERRWGRIGLMELVPRIGEAWRTRREEVLRSADGIIDAVVRAQGAGEREPRGVMGKRGGASSRRKSSTKRSGILRRISTKANGGFGNAPKFPVAHNLSFLLRYWKRTGNARALAMAEKTLETMALGGIWDHLGFGFHRYSTDAEWRVPHFEKMLYDQALLADVYAEASWRQREKANSGGPPSRSWSTSSGTSGARRRILHGRGRRFRGRGRPVLHLDEMQEIEAVLDGEEAALAARIFDIRAEGKFLRTGRLEGRPQHPLLWTSRSPRSRPNAGFSGSARLEAEVASIRGKLLRAREERVRPFRDTKILADWNGLAIGALAKASRMTGETRFLGAAETAARFVLEKMRGPEGRLLHSFMEGEARIPAFLDDYAFLIRGLIEVYEAGFDPFYLERAIELTNSRERGFPGRRRTADFSRSPRRTELPVRPKEVIDGAIPSGNSVMLMNLLRLARMTGRRDLEDSATRLPEAFAPQGREPSRAPMPAFLCGLDHAFGPAAEVVVVGRDRGSPDRSAVERARTDLASECGRPFQADGGGCGRRTPKDG